MLEFMEQFLSGYQGAFYFFLFASAAVEYLLPPYFGDTVIVSGFFLAGTGRLSLSEVFLLALGGSILGACLAYMVGLKFGKLPFLFKSGKKREKSVRSIEAFFRDQGEKFLIINRFLPGLRALFLYLAGMGKMPFGRVFAFSTVSNILWCFFLMYLGSAAGANLDAIKNNLRGATFVIGIPALIALLMMITAHIIKTRGEKKERDLNA